MLIMPQKKKKRHSVLTVKINIDQVGEFKIKSIETENRVMVARASGERGIGSDC